MHFSVQIAFLKLLVMPYKSTKRKQMALTVTKELELIRKFDKGTSVASVCEECGGCTDISSPNIYSPDC